MCTLDLKLTCVELVQSIVEKRTKLVMTITVTTIIINHFTSSVPNDLSSLTNDSEDLTAWQ